MRDIYRALNDFERDFEKVHGVKSLEDIGFTPDMKEKTARVAPYIRDRITFMRILKFYDFYDDVIK